MKVLSWVFIVIFVYFVMIIVPPFLLILLLNPLEPIHFANARFRDSERFADMFK